MFNLRGRTVLTVFVMVTLTLLALLYHMLSTYPPSPVAQAHRSFLNPRTGLPTPPTLSKSPQVPIFKGHKIVHLDLKGAPPVLEYYKYLLQLFRSLGATGILLEYEDTFPYSGELENITSLNAYPPKAIKKIQELAEENDLIVIPLIQTFGHLEFVLKLEGFKDLREVARYPQVVCPTNPKTMPLIELMVDQIMALHPNIEYLHIGADEVYHIGECSRCLEELAKKQWTKRQLFLSHIKKVTGYIKHKYPKVKILMWDDEFRDITPSEIMETGLNKVVEPVVWKYTRNPASSLNEQLWEGYAETWGEVWVATAFKGATDPDRYYTDISHHLENHQHWLEIITHYSDKIHFKGAILTGWQRYDHFSVLCELLASALPSLAVNLAVLQSKTINEFWSETPAFVTEALQCESPVSLTIAEPNWGWTKCRFQGVEIYSAILRLFNLNLEMSKMEQENTYKGWLKEYNIKHRFSNPSHVERAVADLDRFKMELVYIEKEMKSAMDGIYDDDTFSEWIETFVVPLNEKIMRLWDAKEKILEKEVWPRRPLKSEL